ncbi:hypothetical protein P8452_51917 [Trifolium repens]|jgi:hypothetical protein|nr:hypothetical protein P8452_51917 [Trifolium repens]
MVPELSLMDSNTISGTVNGFSAATTEAEAFKTKEFPLPISQFSIKTPFLCFKLHDFEEPQRFDLNETDFAELGLREVDEW